ncbi:DNA polymerase III subunit alpha [Planctomycetota bacterium]
MSDKGFVHLHLHTQYSLLDGAVAPKKLFKRCKEQGMDTVAMTDHGNMFGAIDFYMRAKGAEVKPIIGCEAYISPTTRFDKSGGGIKNAAFHLVLLAENLKGYQNLLKLSSAGYTEGFYYRPRIDLDILSELSEGLIGCSACIKGQVPNFLRHGDEKAALEIAEAYAKIFGPERFYIEIQKHVGDVPDVNEGLIQIAKKVGLGLVATNDVHFLDKDDYEAHSCLTCISTGKQFDDPDRMVYPTNVFLKSAQEMRELFADYPESCDNTVHIANRCNVEIDLKSQHAPRYEPPTKETPEQYLRRLVYEGCERLYGKITEVIEERIKRELDVIEGKGFSSYFLIVWDFCNYARERDIPVGARGSGVGTIVGYALGMCDVDPIKYDLLFERFMDPERNEMPDIDIDICQSNRQNVIDYVRQKYGQVAQIITFGTMKARAVIRDVCRVLGVPLDQADKLAKLVPEELKMTLDKALEVEPELKKLYDEDPQIHRVIEIGKRLEGLTRHSSVHAAGVVVADCPLTDHVPLYKAPGSDDLITQYEGPLVEKVGLLKMDFLGLKTLSVLRRTRELIREIHDLDIDPEKIDQEDAKTFEVFCKGRTKGVFQFESGGMQNLLIKMQPDRIEDLIAANALYRPGPMILIPDYIERKHGAKWSLPHPIMTEILGETYGIMTYQEQVMRICNRLGDIPLRQAYGLIKAISKKKTSIIAAEKERFLKGCADKGLTVAQASEIWEIIERFAGYGFNKSHSTRYAFVAYQTAYFKAHYPVEFMAALLTYDRDVTEKVVDYIQECTTELEIEILPPDINESGVHFTPSYPNGQEKQGVIRFGLGGIKGVGTKAVERIIDARSKVGRFESLFHFCEHVDLRAANKQVLEALIKAGCFDHMGANRRQMVEGLERAMQNGAGMQADLASGQMNFFEEIAQNQGGEEDKNHFPEVPPWPEQQMLTYEKQVLGFYVTSNPLSHHAEDINIFSTCNTNRLNGIKQDREIIIGGMIARIRYNIIKNGRNAGAKMAVIMLEDLQGQVEVVVFPRTFSKFGHMLVEDRVIFVRGTVDTSREKPNILADEIIAHEEVREKIGARVAIKLETHNVTEERITEIRSVCEHYKGRSPLWIAIQADGGKVYANANRLNVNPTTEFFREMRHLVGDGNVVLTK